MAIFQALLGIVVLLGICILLSADRSKINWRLVISGILLQFVFGFLVLKVPFVESAFQWIAGGFVKLLSYTDAGAEFVLGKWPTVAQVTDGISGEMVTVGYIFAFKVLPTILFFSALSSLLYYLGILQILVYAFAWLMNKTMQLTGAESLAAAANVFIGQTEAPLVVKPYLEDMSKSEIMALMTGGMATIAGGVFGAYVGLLGGDSPAEQAAFAKHLLSASIMSAPAALVAAKILFPETSEDVNREINIPKEKIGSNLLDAISNGTTDGLKLAFNVGAMLLVFTAFMAMLNGIFGAIGNVTGLNDLVGNWTDNRYTCFNLQFIFGMLFAPIAWLIGVGSQDIMLVGQVIGEKTILNEFFAYVTLGDMKTEGLIVNPKSAIIATYALCGFANFASIGIQIGGISAIAPGQRETLSALGIKALIGGTIACLLTAAIAGILL